MDKSPMKFDSNQTAVYQHLTGRIFLITLADFENKLIYFNL